MFFEFRMRKKSPHSPLAFLFPPCHFPFIFVSSSSPFPLPFIWVSFSKDGHMTSVKRGWAKAAKRVYANVCQNSADTTLYYGPIFNTYKDMLPSLNITVFFLVASHEIDPDPGWNWIEGTNGSLDPTCYTD